MQNAITKLGYSDEGTTGYVFSDQEPHSVPLYRLYNSKIFDHFYTTNEAEKDNAAAKLGYNYEGIAGYVYPDTACGALPLYRLYSSGATDHFYTMSAAERDNASNKLGYTQEGIAGYIFPFWSPQWAMIGKFILPWLTLAILIDGAYLRSIFICVDYEIRPVNKNIQGSIVDRLLTDVLPLNYT